MKRNHTVFFNGVYPGRFSDFTNNIKEAQTMTYAQAVNFVNRVHAAGGSAKIVGVS